MAIRREQLGDLELTQIDYRDETGPLYYVVIDGTPMLPEMPLPWEEAQRKAEQERAENPDSSVEVTECTDEDLAWAGVRR